MRQEEPLDSEELGARRIFRSFGVVLRSPDSWWRVWLFFHRRNKRRSTKRAGV